MHVCMYVCLYVCMHTYIQHSQLDTCYIRVLMHIESPEVLCIHAACVSIQNAQVNERRRERDREVGKHAVTYV